ncbi:MAG: hypothetical protein ACUVWP_08035, partial [bacterium]
MRVVYIILFVIFLILIISPLDILPGSQFDDIVYTIIDIILGILIMMKRKVKEEKLKIIKRIFN